MENEELDLKELFTMFWNKKFTIILVTILFAIIGAAYSFYMVDPVFTASTTLILVSKRNEETETASNLQTELNVNSKLVSTYRQILKSKLVVQQVIDDLDLDVDYSSLSKRIDVQSIEDTEILKVTVTDESAEDATEIANKLSKVFGDEVSKIYKINNVSIIDTAEVPTEPSNINTIKNVVIVSLIGFVVSSGIVFIIFYFA